MQNSIRLRLLFEVAIYTYYTLTHRNMVYNLPTAVRRTCQLSRFSHRFLLFILVTAERAVARRRLDTVKSFNVLQVYLCIYLACIMESWKNTTFKPDARLPGMTSFPVGKWDFRTISDVAARWWHFRSKTEIFKLEVTLPLDDVTSGWRIKTFEPEVVAPSWRSWFDLK